MKWKEVAVTLDRDVAYLYDHIRTYEKRCIVAGGYLSDRYMGIPPKDVDVFLSGHADINSITACLKRIGAVMQQEPLGKSPHYPWNFIVYTFLFRGKKVQLIFTAWGIQSVKYFDLRMREFFYFNGKTYASEEALGDIRSKQLVFGVSMNPHVTLKRLAQFRLRYHFEVAEESLERLMAYIAYQGIHEKYSVFTDIDHAVEVTMIEWLEEYTTFKKESSQSSLYMRKGRYRPTDPCVRTFMSTPVERDVSERCFALESRKKEGIIKMSDSGFDPFSQVAKQLVEDKRAELKQEAVRCFLEGKFFEWKSLDLHLEELQTANRFGPKDTATMTRKLKGDLETRFAITFLCDRLHVLHEKENSERRVTTSRMPSDTFSSCIREVSLGEVIELKIEGVGTIVYSQKTMRIFYCSLSSSLSRLRVTMPTYAGSLLVQWFLTHQNHEQKSI